MSEELDPYVAPNLESAELSWLYADGLMGSDLSRPLAGSLCARPPALRTFGPSGSVSFDYELRRGVRWHDGKPLVAQDIADCFARLRATTWAHQRPFSLVTHIDVGSERHLTVHLSEADRRFPLAFFTPFGSPGLPLVRPGRLPIGTGPFKVTARTPDAVTFARWSGSPRGTPRVGSLRLRYLSGGNTQSVMLFSGETDVALFVPHDEVLRRGFPYFRRRSGVLYLVFNVTGSLDSPGLRRSVAAAIDAETIARTFYSGWTSRYRSIVAPDVAGSQTVLAPTYDSPAARSVLRSFSGQLKLATYPGDAQRIMLLVQDQLRRANVKGSLRTYPVQEYLAPNGPLRSGQFDLALFGEMFSLDPDLTSTWGCKAIPPKGGNFSRLCDPHFDALAQAGNLPAALNALAEEVAVIPLVQSLQCVGTSKRLRGAADPPGLVSSVFQCADWQLA